MIDLYYCPALFLGTGERILLDELVARGARACEVSEDPFRKMSYRDRPEGLLGVAAHFDTGLDRLTAPPDALVLVVESIEKPGNLGTMLRTACAAGACGVIVADQTTDVFNPNVVRASLGTLFCLPTAVTSTPGAIAWLRARGFSVVVAAPAGAVPHWDACYAGRVAVVVGSEQYGLSREWLDAADAVVRIPMPGQVDSLNASAATAILLFDCVRRRSASPVDAPGGR